MSKWIKLAMFLLISVLIWAFGIRPVIDTTMHVTSQVKQQQEAQESYYEQFLGGGKK